MRWLPDVVMTLLVAAVVALLGLAVWHSVKFKCVQSHVETCTNYTYIYNSDGTIMLMIPNYYDCDVCDRYEPRDP